MQVDVLASTLMKGYPLRNAYGYEPFSDEVDSEYVEDADALAEAAGRLCYRSFNRPNPKTARNEDYIKNIIDQDHSSVLEHASVTFLVRGVSRALLADFTRHRHLSFSVVSQRYCDYSKTEPVIPPALEGYEAIIRDFYTGAVEQYEAFVDVLMEEGFKRKQAREAARAVLPNAAPVDLIVTGNLTAWRHVLWKRHHVAADAEIQQLAGLILGHLRTIAPNSFADIPDKPFGSEN